MKVCDWCQQCEAHHCLTCCAEKRLEFAAAKLKELTAEGVHPGIAERMLMTAFETDKSEEPNG